MSPPPPSGSATGFDITLALRKQISTEMIIQWIDCHTQGQF
jgi:hypothetical protein